MTVPTLGLVVNPIAGMGGRVGLHGTDGDDLARARERGARPVSPQRAARTLARLRELVPELGVVTAGGAMGADVLDGSDGWHVTVLPVREGRPEGTPDTDGSDTRAAVAAMVAAGVQLVLFVGGDGTARDVSAAAGDAVPVLGVPAGVKMHSGVFGLTPDAAATAAGRFLSEPAWFGTQPAEVVDRDEDGGIRLFGTVRVPAVPSTVQHHKGGVSGRDDAGPLAAEVAAEMRPDQLYLLGPGTTVAQVGAALGIATTPLGVDAVVDGTVVARDADEATLLGLLAAHPQATLILGVVGGQGFLLGRGNQQLSPRVLAALGPENIEVLATPAKVAALEEPVLHLDIDDPDLVARLVGYRRVRTGRSRSTVLRVVA